jgi:hypothetical protein
VSRSFLNSLNGGFVALKNTENQLYCVLRDEKWHI